MTADLAWKHKSDGKKDESLHENLKSEHNHGSSNILAAEKLELMKKTSYNC